MSAVEDIQQLVEQVKASGRSKPRVGRFPVNEPMIGHWLDDGFDVVFTAKAHRGNESALRRFGVRAFYALLRRNVATGATTVGAALRSKSLRYVINPQVPSCTGPACQPQADSESIATILKTRS